VPFTLPGNRIWENSTPVTLALSPIVSGWYETTGFTNMLLSWVFTNSTGTTTPSIEGSFDGATLDTDMTYAALAGASQLTTGLVVAVLTPYVRFRIVQATADATRTKIFVQARQ
jgi:hypothetical protein